MEIKKSSLVSVGLDYECKEDPFSDEFLVACESQIVMLFPGVILDGKRRKAIF